MVRRVRPLVERWSAARPSRSDYEVDEKKRTVGVLEPGVEQGRGLPRHRQPLRVGQHAAGRLPEQRHQGQGAVQARQGLRRHERRGPDRRRAHRPHPAGRRYNEGMHQAIEAKEGVEIKDENQTLATITLQNYFRLYDKLSGMTGTAKTEAAEFHKIYKLGVVPIPTNRPMIRADQPDLVYKTEEAKFDAVVEDIVERHAHGQPVLVGTTSVEKSELLSDLLQKRGVPHEVLNAKQHEREAAIVAQAGRKGAVTVATNMAGRGTDIMLGGNAEFLAVAELRSRGSTRSRRRRSTRPPGRTRSRRPEGRRRRARRGHRARRALRARHRAARVAPHRQPAARPLRPAGRPGRVPVLPVAAGRPDAAVQRGDGRDGHDPAQHPRRRADRVQDGHPRDPERADPGRGAATSRSARTS